LYELAEGVATTDLRMARNALERMRDPPPLSLIAPRAWMILQWEWRSVERVAHRLAARLTLGTRKRLSRTAFADDQDH
jgi:hypothetical protein